MVPFASGESNEKRPKAVALLSATAEQTKEQTREIVDIYFDLLRRSFPFTPSGVIEFDEMLKTYSQRNLAATHKFVRQLSYAKDFQDMVRIRAEFMQILLRASVEQAKDLGEAYTKAKLGPLRSRRRSRHLPDHPKS